MIILVKDYRFLLIEAFLRLALDGALALGTVYTLFVVAQPTSPLNVATNPGLSVITIILARLALALFVQRRRFAFDAGDATGFRATRYGSTDTAHPGFIARMRGRRGIS